MSIFDKRLRRIERLRHARPTGVLVIRTSFEAECICFPVAPRFHSQSEKDEASNIECQLHGKRFVDSSVPGAEFYRAAWLRQRMPYTSWVPEVVRAQYEKAW